MLQRVGIIRNRSVDNFLFASIASEAVLHNEESRAMFRASVGSVGKFQ